MALALACVSLILAGFWTLLAIFEWRRYRYDDDLTERERSLFSRLVLAHGLIAYLTLVQAVCFFVKGE